MANLCRSFVCITEQKALLLYVAFSFPLLWLAEVGALVSVGMSELQLFC